MLTKDTHYSLASREADRNIKITETVNKIPIITDVNATATEIENKITNPTTLATKLLQIQKPPTEADLGLLQHPRWSAL